MPQTLTIEYIKSKINSDEYELITKKYINNRTDLKILHKKCGKTFKMNYDHWQRGQRCPYCGRTKYTKTQDKFDDEVEQNNPNRYKFLEPYVNKRTKIHGICNKCGNELYMLPRYFIKGMCVHCAAQERADRYRKDVKDIKLPAGYHITGQYKNNKTPVEIIHNDCGKTFMMSTSNLCDRRQMPILLQFCVTRGKRL